MATLTVPSISLKLPKLGWPLVYFKLANGKPIFEMCAICLKFAFCPILLYFVPGNVLNPELFVLMCSSDYASKYTTSAD